MKFDTPTTDLVFRIAEGYRPPARELVQEARVELSGLKKQLTTATVRVTELEQRLAEIACLAHDDDADTHERRSVRLGRCNAIALGGTRGPELDRGVLAFTSLADRVVQLPALNQQMLAVVIEASSWRLGSNPGERFGYSDAQEYRHSGYRVYPNNAAADLVERLDALGTAPLEPGIQPKAKR